MKTSVTGAGERVTPERARTVMNNPSQAIRHRRAFFISTLIAEAPEQVRQLLTPDLIARYGERHNLNQVSPESLVLMAQRFQQFAAWVWSSDGDPSELFRPRTDAPSGTRYSPDGGDVLRERFQPELEALERRSKGPDGRFDLDRFQAEWSRRHTEVTAAISVRLDHWLEEHNLTDDWIAPLLDGLLDRAAIADAVGDEPLAAMQRWPLRFWNLDMVRNDRPSDDFVSTFLKGERLRPEWLPGPDDDLDEWRDALSAEFARFLDAEAAAPRVVNAPDIRQMQHFAWLVRYQVLGETYEEIADTSDDVAGSYQAVSQPVNRLARSIGLMLRESDHSGRRRRQPPRIVRTRQGPGVTGSRESST